MTNNCNCTNCPYNTDNSDVQEFVVGDTIDVSFRLDEVLEDATYYIAVYNQSTNKCVLMREFSELDDLGDGSYNLNIDHTISATLLPRTYYAEIGFKTTGGVVNVIDNSIKFKINKSNLGRTI